MKWIKKLFCWHFYTKIGFRVEDNGYVRYSVRQYRCKKCGKIIWVDARYKNTCEPDKPLIGWFAQ